MAVFSRRDHKSKPGRAGERNHSRESVPLPEPRNPVRAYRRASRVEEAQRRVGPGCGASLPVAFAAANRVEDPSSAGVCGERRHKQIVWKTNPSVDSSGNR